MAGIDASIPLQYKPFDFDAAKTIGGIQAIGLHQQQYRKQEATYNALQEYGNALKTGDEEQIQSSIAKVGAVDPEQGKTLLGLRQGVRQAGAQDKYGKSHDPNDVAMFPEVEHVVNSAKAIKDENVRKQTVHKLDVGGRHAEAWLRNPTNDTWDPMLDNMKRDGGYTEQELAPYRGKPNVIQASRMRAAGMGARESMEVTGEAAGNRPVGVAPQESLVVPNQVAFGKDSTANSPAPLAGGKANNPDGTLVPHPDMKKDPVFNEIPKTNYGKTGPTGPGVIRQGTDPTFLDAAKNANEHYSKEIQPAADASAKAKGELQIIRSALEKENSGAISTGATAGIRETAAGLVYELGRLAGDPKAAETAQAMTGINPTTADVQGKASTRLGFDMSREQGAREAVQVLQYAFRANPNMYNTKEGNLVVTGVLDGVADWKIQRSDYANKWMLKNGNLVGFDSWYNRAHPVEQFTSKAYPSEYPKNPADLKNDVTYQWDQQDGDKVKPMKGKWNAERGGMEIQ